MRLLILLLFFFLSCNAEDIFKNKIYTYIVTQTNSSQVDTLIILHKSNFLSDKLETKFKYSKDSSVITMQREGDYTSSSSNISILSPIGGYLDNTEYLPYPQLDLPPQIGDSIYSEHKMPDHLSKKNQIVKGYLKVVDKKLYNNELLNDNVWVVQSFNLENKNNSATYYYSQKYGFVQLNYFFGINQITIKLINIETHVEK